MRRVTVTGIGGGAGMSIVKSLRRLQDCYIVGLDADEYAAGRDLVDEFHKIPEAVDKDFVDKLAIHSRGSVSRWQMNRKHHRQ